MSDSFIISPMSASEISIAIDWAAEEGWNPGLHDAETFFAANPNGFFVGKLKGEPIVVASATIYDERFAFFGLYIVKKPYRGQGYGWQITQARLRHVGNRNLGLDGVVEQQATYAKIGFKLAHRTLRYQISASHIAKKFNQIVYLNTLPFKNIETYDRQCFLAPRSAFLHAWISQADSAALGFVEADRLYGYGVIRRCRVGYKIGPLFAENFVIAEQLFLSLIDFAEENAPVVIDIPEPNADGLLLVDKYKMQPVFETGRMYTQAPPKLPLEKIYGMTTLEIG